MGQVIWRHWARATVHKNIKAAHKVFSSFAWNLYNLDTAECKREERRKKILGFPTLQLQNNFDSKVNKKLGSGLGWRFVATGHFGAQILAHFCWFLKFGLGRATQNLAWVGPLKTHRLIWREKQKKFLPVVKIQRPGSLKLKAKRSFLKAIIILFFGHFKYLNLIGFSYFLSSDHREMVIVT